MSSQEQPELPGAAGSTEEQPGATRSSQEQPGAAKEQPGAGRAARNNSQETAPRSIELLTGAVRTAGIQKSKIATLRKPNENLVQRSDFSYFWRRPWGEVLRSIGPTPGPTYIVRRPAWAKTCPDLRK